MFIILLDFAKALRNSSSGNDSELSDVMTPKEETCYANRYSDLGNQTAIEHYLSTGQD